MIVELKIAVLVVVSVALAVLTRRSLISFRLHGVFRLLAWVTSLALVLLNIDYWFDDPYGARQMASWLLFVISIAVVFYGTISLHRGKPDSRRDDPALMGIERTTELVITGAYRYIRHPMYSSFLFGAWGVFFKHFSLSSALLALLTTFFAVMTAKKEESENIGYFGDAYRDYMKRTKMFIPFLF
ncbi:MAG: isoprenylcysteine carboxylmethyltransferase family protein [Candidatus Zixiibacteriota bacterium]